MAAAAQTAAAAEAAAACFNLYIIDGRCRRLEGAAARDMRRRDAALQRSQRHLTRRVLTRSACFGSKARKHENPFGHLTKGRNDRKGHRKSGWFLVRPIFLRFLGFFLDFGNPPFSNTQNW